MTTWQTGSPSLGQTISTSLSDIRDNWTVLATAWNGDHETLTGDGTSSTRHNQVTLPEQPAAPAAATPNTGFVYTKDVSGATELFYEDEAANEYQLSGSLIDAANGEVFLPGGLSMKWGTATMTTGTEVYEYVGDFGISAFTTDTYSIVTTRIGTDGNAFNIDVSALTKDGFTARSGLATSSFNFIAIGK